MNRRSIAKKVCRRRKTKAGVMVSKISTDGTALLSAAYSTISKAKKKIFFCCCALLNKNK